MVVLTVQFHQLRLKIVAYLREHAAKTQNGITIQYPTPVFRHEDQMDVELKYTMPAVSYSPVYLHRPKYNRIMKQFQAFKYQARPNGEQTRRMRRFAGARRFVFNKTLALQNERQEKGLEPLGYAALCHELAQWRHAPQTEWLSEIPIHPLQQALKDLQRAFANHKEGRAEPPRFKKKGHSPETFRYPDPGQITLDQNNNRLKLPKLGWVRYRNSRTVLGNLKQVAVNESGSKWFVVIQTEREAETPTPPAGKPIGIDVGISRFVTLNDGTCFPPLNSFKKHAQTLRKAQQALSRKCKFSNNWKKAQARIERLHARIANARRDYLHKVSTTLCKTHAVICIEDLKLKNMTKSAKGTKEQPGHNVKQKSGLNRAILDQGWGEFRRQLSYKTQWNGGILVAVPPANTSRICPCCGHISARNRPSQTRFRCVSCGFEAHADQVGGINVLRAGHARIACEVSGERVPPAAGTHRSDPGTAQCLA